MSPAPRLSLMIAVAGCPDRGFFRVWQRLPLGLSCGERDAAPQCPVIRVGVSERLTMQIGWRERDWWTADDQFPSDKAGAGEVGGANIMTGEGAGSELKT